MISYLLSAPATEPVTLDEARAFVRMDDTGEDALLTTLISAARLHVESVTARALLSQGWRVVLDAWPPGFCIALPVAPALSLTAITAYDLDGNGTAMPLADVLVDGQGTPPRLFLPADLGNGVVLRDRQAIEIDYVAGYGTNPTDVPATLRQAVLLLIGYWFENRDSVIIAGSGSVIPAGLDQMIAPYRAVRL